MWSVQQTPSPDDPSCQPFVLVPLATFLYYSLKESLYFYFALSTTGHTARLPIDHHDQLGSVYEFMPLNESGALIHWGQRDFSKFIALCSFVYSPTSKKHKICFWRLNSRPLDDNLAAWEWEQFRNPTKRQERCSITSHKHLWAAVTIFHLSPPCLNHVDKLPGCSN